MTGLVTVFGGGGFVGRHAVRALARKGYRIRVAMRRPNQVPELRVMGDVGQIELVQANIRNADSVARALDGAEAVVNLVGVLYQAGPQTFDAVQSQGAGLIARLAAEQGIRRFVQVSAIGASATSPSVYARSKAAGEAAVRAALPGAVILRPSIVFGPEDDFFNRFAAMAAVSPVLPLIGGGKTRFQPVYVGDVAAAITAVLGDPATGDPAKAGRTYELGGPGVYSFRELMTLLLADIRRERLLLPVPFGVAGLLGRMGDLMSFLPIAPWITSVQVALLKRDHVVAAGALGLRDLGVTPSPMEPILPTYLYRFMKGGQYADEIAAAAALAPR